MEGTVSLHTVCSLILPIRPQRRTRIRGDSITDNNTNTRTSQLHEPGRAAHQYDRQRMTLCVYAQVTSCGKKTTGDANIHIGIQIEYNKCSSGCLTRTLTTLPPWVYATSLLAAIPGLSVHIGERQTSGNRKPSPPQLPSACRNDPQYHYLTSTWHTQGHLATNARALNYTACLG